MKLLKLNKLLITSTLLLALSACGGDDEESSSNNSNYIPPTNSTVSGQFYNSAETGKYFSTENFPSYQQYGQSARHCYQSYNDYYFESDKTMVFGNPDLPESDFKQAATWVENNLASALTSMGISEQDFFLLRTNIRIDARKRLRNLLEYKSIDNFNYPAEFDSWQDQKVSDWATNTVKNLSNNDIESILLNSSYSNYQSKQDFVIEEKIYVCLHENTQPYGWGEGTAIGITIGAESIVVPDNINKLIQHELIHTIQHAISGDIDGFKLPRWFSEGQAVYLSGMSVAKKAEHNDYDPTLVVSFYDEYGDSGLAYEHYGLAYQYIKDSNGQQSIITMMKNMGALSHDYSIQLNSALKENHNYVEIFNTQIKQQNGNPLTVSEYRNNYHSLMATYAN
ncbi:hypothetical protein ACOYR1_13155 [Thalassotalea piscium]